VPTSDGSTATGGSGTLGATGRELGPDGFEPPIDRL
jgi:hypothetical protein